MEAAESRPCKALRPQEAGFYEEMRKMQRTDGSETGSGRHAGGTAQQTPRKQPNRASLRSRQALSRDEVIHHVARISTRAEESLHDFMRRMNLIAVERRLIHE